MKADPIQGRMTFSGFTYGPLPERIFPLRVLNGVTNNIAGKWQWQDDHWNPKSPMSKISEPAPKWRIVHGTVTKSQFGTVEIKWTTRHLVSQTTESVPGREADKFARMGLFVGGVGSVASDQTRVIASEYEPVGHRQKILHVPKIIMPAIGSSFSCYAYENDATTADFGAVPGQEVETAPEPTPSRGLRPHPIA